jgi:hypothetical protein
MVGRRKRITREANRQFDVALSFASEDRAYVEKVAQALTRMGIRVFYDKYEVATLWGKNLYDHLQEVYQENARYAVIFISNHYAKKLWTNHERKSAQARAFSSNQEYILPARFDNTRIPGILSTTAYVDLAGYAPRKFAEIIKDKVGPIQRFEFFPDEPDLLYESVGVRRKRERESIKFLAEAFFESLKLMTPEEKDLLVAAVESACPAGLPENVHLSIELLSRQIRLPVERITGDFARLDSLGIVSRVYSERGGKDNLCKAKKIVEFKYKPLLADVDIDNATFIIVAMIRTVNEHLCPECRQRAFDHLDFSVLGRLTGYPDDVLENQN